MLTPKTQTLATQIIYCFSVYYEEVELLEVELEPLEPVELLEVELEPPGLELELACLLKTGQTGHPDLSLHFGGISGFCFTSVWTQFHFSNWNPL